ncbi:MAG: arylesterase [Salibaculum sp.]|uniref:arylesterase n=1 Tax=Salibaculum sp. TaxID=2855480 RepID=UPI00286FB044|nr:arylesterase [Salibaculum sp.]MDR9428861.1 arylesterase [Salibaculum sp.]MDR9483308.1 arylesterase [Salibaculum sp.]
MARAFGMLRSLTYGAIGAARNAAAALLVLAGAAQAETVTIAALGDSLTQGYGLIDEEGFVPQMEAWLRDQGAEVALVNAGVSGDTTAGGLSRVNWTLTPQVDALIVALGGNDMLRGIAPEVARANLDGIMQAASQADKPVLLVGMQAPGNYGPDYKDAFDAIYPDLADTYDSLLFPNFFEGIMAEDLSRVRETYMQPDGIHPNADGVKRIVEAMGPAVLDLVARVD